MQDKPLPTPPESGVLQKSIMSGTWLTLGYSLQKVISAISFFILARLLAPADFGAVAIVLLVPKFLESTSETGLSSAIIQRTGDIRPYLSPIWTIGITKAVLIAVVTFLAAPGIGMMLHAPHLVSAIRWGGVFIIIQNLSNIGETYFFRDLNFRKIFIRNLVRDIVYLIAALFLVVVFPSYWALIYATALSYTAQMISTYVLHPFRPRLEWHWRKLGALIPYSKWVAVQGWLSQLYSATEQALVARLTSVTDLGLYSKGKNVAAIVPGLLGPILRSVGFSAFSKIQTDRAKVVDGFIKSLHVVFFIQIPVSITLMIVAYPLVEFVLGTPWIGMAPVLRILAGYYLIGTVGDITDSILNALGYPEQKAKTDTLKIVVTLGLMYPFIHMYGISGAALALLIGFLLPVLANIMLIARLTAIRYRDLLSTMVAPTMSTVLAIIPLVAVPLLSSWTPLVLFLSMLSAILIYLGVILLTGLTWGLGPYKTLATIITYVGHRLYGKYYSRSDV